MQTYLFGALHMVKVNKFLVEWKLPQIHFCNYWRIKLHSLEVWKNIDNYGIKYEKIKGRPHVDHWAEKNSKSIDLWISFEYAFSISPWLSSLVTKDRRERFFPYSAMVKNSPWLIICKREFIIVLPTTTPSSCFGDITRVLFSTAQRWYVSLVQIAGM